MMRLYKITMDHVGHGHCPSKQIAAPDVETAIKVMKQNLDKYHTNRDGTPVDVIAVDTITHIDYIANGKGQSQ
jgi:glutamate dehydrogenase/leucine dehydrogenase